MPLYEYQCNQCGEREEVIQKFSDPPLGLCSRCGGEMKKLFSSPAIQFKGSGFYKTDYASKPAGTASVPAGEAKGDSKSDGKSDSSKSETKTETKSEAKTETKSETKSTAATETKST